MKIYLDCYACFLRQALKAARLATEDEVAHREVLDQVALMLPGIAAEGTPVRMGQLVHRLVRKITGVADPYQKLKKESNELGLSLYPRMRQWVREADDPLATAIKIAGAGNIVDYGPDHHIDLHASLISALKKPIDAVSYQSFQDKLSHTNRILVIGDNAGEIVCDRVLVEELRARGKHVTYVVRGSAVLNDATLVDVQQVGLNKCASIITTGSDSPGVCLEHVSSEFRAVFHEATLIIAKGQGNYEGLSGETGPIFFLFTVKCPVVARDASAQVGNIVLREQALS